MYCKLLKLTILTDMKHRAASLRHQSFLFLLSHNSLMRCSSSTVNVIADVLFELLLAKIF